MHSSHLIPHADQHSSGSSSSQARMDMERLKQQMTAHLEAPEQHLEAPEQHPSASQARMDLELLKRRMTAHLEAVDQHSSERMELDLLNQQMMDRIEALEKEGYVDDYFQFCYSLKRRSGITFFIGLLPTFLNDAGAALDDMTDILEYPILDYEKLNNLCIKLLGSSACIGATRIHSGCSDLIKAILDRSNEDCIKFLENLKKEKNSLEIKLQAIMKLEYEIVDKQKKLMDPEDVVVSDESDEFEDAENEDDVEKEKDE